MIDKFIKNNAMYTKTMLCLVVCGSIDMYIANLNVGELKESISFDDKRRIFLSTLELNGRVEVLYDTEYREYLLNNLSYCIIIINSV
jgi:hypothetical protein